MQRNVTNRSSYTLKAFGSTATRAQSRDRRNERRDWFAKGFLEAFDKRELRLGERVIAVGSTAVSDHFAVSFAHRRILCGTPGGAQQVAVVGKFAAAIEEDYRRIVGPWSAQEELARNRTDAAGVVASSGRNIAIPDIRADDILSCPPLRAAVRDWISNQPPGAIVYRDPNGDVALRA